MRLRVGVSVAAFAAIAAIVPALAPAKGPHVCKGTAKSPGVLAAGPYKTGVVVKGVCAVNAGAAHVFGTLTIKPGSELIAAFGKNHRTGHGRSSLTVTGDVLVGRGAVFVLGCNTTSSPCIDDPGKHPTLTSPGKVTGDITETAPLGVIIHTTRVGGDIKQTGGGGGLSCKPPKTGPFALIGAPVFSDYEDNSVGGDISISKMKSCYLGVGRDRVGGNLSLINNKLGDPDAIEILKNNVAGDLVCRHNSMVWDSNETSPSGALYPRALQRNKVHGKRFGQCVKAGRLTKGGKPAGGPF